MTLHIEEHRHHGPGHDLIHFKVDGEPFTTEAKELTPNAIIQDFAGKALGNHYLVQIQGHEKKSFQGLGDIPITMHDGMRFQVICTGPTPVSGIVR